MTNDQYVLTLQRIKAGADEFASVCTVNPIADSGLDQGGGSAPTHLIHLLPESSSSSTKLGCNIGLMKVNSISRRQRSTQCESLAVTSPIRNSRPTHP